MIFSYAQRSKATVYDLYVDNKKNWAFDFCRFCVVIPFFIPTTTAKWPPTLKNFYPRFYLLHFCPVLILEKEPVFPFLMLRTKQGNYWYHFYNVFGMTRSLTGDWTWDLPHSNIRLWRRRFQLVWTSKCCAYNVGSMLFLFVVFRVFTLMCSAILVPMDLDVKLKAVMLGAVFLIVSIGLI